MWKRLYVALVAAILCCSPAGASQNSITMPLVGPLTMAQVMQLLNDGLDTLATNYSGATNPTLGGAPRTYQTWMDTSTTPPTWRVYDGTDYIPFLQFDATANTTTIVGGSAAGSDLTFKTTLGVGSGDEFLWKGGTDGATTRMTLTSTLLSMGAGISIAAGSSGYVSAQAFRAGTGSILALDNTGGYNRFYDGDGANVSILMGSTTAGDLSNYYRNNAHRFQTSAGAASMAVMTSTSLALAQTTASTSSTTGSLIVAGGAGIAGRVHVGAGLDMQQDPTNPGLRVRARVSDNVGSIQFTDSALSAQYGAITFNATQWSFLQGATPLFTLTSTTLAVQPATASTSSTTGALTVAGGVGVAGSIYGGGAISALGTSGFKFGTTDILKVVSTNYTALNAPDGSNRVYFGSAADPANYFSANSHRYRSADQATNYGIFDANGLYSYPTNDATSTANGSLNTQGGLGVAKKAFIGGDVNLSSTTASTTTTTGALIVAGGVGIAGAVYTGSTITVGTTLTAAANVVAVGSSYARATTAIPAGGTTGYGFQLSSTANFGIFFGSGAPTLSAAKGSLYLRSDGSGTGDRLYVNHNGTTGWYAITTAS